MRNQKQFFELKNFLILWSTQSVSSFGTAMTNYALILWAYRQQGTASEIAFLSVCSCLPSILFCFAAGTLADRWNKKKIMLFSDGAAALGTLAVLLLYSTASLRLWHLYLVNFILSFMDAFQNPAAYVVETLLIPKPYYTKASGLQALSGSLVAVLAPAAATAVLSFWGMRAVFFADLLSFFIAFLALLRLVQIPDLPSGGEAREPFWKSCAVSLSFLRRNLPLLKLILFFSFINLLSYLGTAGSLLSVMVLARSGNDQWTLGTVSSATGLGTLAGSLLVTLAKPAKSRIRTIFFSCAVSFLLCDILFALGRNAAVWVLAAFAGNLPLPFLNVNLMTVMRSKVPVQMQGRVFSARDTLQHLTIPIGLTLGGVLVDTVFEPLMRGQSPLCQILSVLVGTGRGSGIAVIFFMTGTLGFVSSLLCLRNPVFRELDS